MGLRQVEFVAGKQKRVGFGGERALEQACFLAIMPAPRTPWSGAVVSHPDAHAWKALLTALIMQYPRAVGFGAAAQEFVQHAFVAPRERIAHKLRFPEALLHAVLDYLGIGIELRHPETGRQFEHLTGIDHQHVIAVLLREAQQLGVVVAEIDPMALMQLARNAAQSIANDVPAAEGRDGQLFPEPCLVNKIFDELVSSPGHSSASPASAKSGAASCIPRSR